MQLSLAPSTLDLEIYAGDGASLQVKATDANNNPLNITGAVMAEIRVNKQDPNPPLLSFTVDLSQGATGIINLSLTGAQTATLISGTGNDPFRGYWDCQWTPSSGQPVTLLRGALTCDVDVSR